MNKHLKPEAAWGSLPPHHPLHIICVAQYDADHFVADVGHRVVGHGAEVPGLSGLLVLQLNQALHHPFGIQTHHHYAGLFHSLGPFMGLPDIERTEVQDG